MERLLFLTPKMCVHNIMYSKKHNPKKKYIMIFFFEAMNIIKINKLSSVYTYTHRWYSIIHNTSVKHPLFIISSA